MPLQYPVPVASMDSPESVIFIPSKHDGILLETLVHLPKAIAEHEAHENVAVAVIAHPWSLLGGSMYDHVVQSMFDVFADAGCLVAAFNCRGAGKSGGHGNASAQTEVEDYQSVLTRIMSYAETKNLPISNLYICVTPTRLRPESRDTVPPLRVPRLTLAHGSFTASLVPPPIPQTNYILISPLLTPISSLTTFFSSSPEKSILSKHSAQSYATSVKRILAVYGSGDIFAFTTGRYRRYFNNVKEHWGEQIRVIPVESGGHFWLDARSKSILLEEVKGFIQSS